MQLAQVRWQNIRDHSILGVIENMSYFESKETGNKEYVFGKGGGTKLADELNTQLLGNYL